MNNDYELFKEKIGIWEERFIERVFKEYEEIMSCDKPALEKFLILQRRINDDRKYPAIDTEIGLSGYLTYSLAMFVTDEIVDIKELDEFSDELKKDVIALRKYFCKVSSIYKTRFF